LALTPGTRLGVYEVTAAIGEGGMGQVYRATDTTLGRQVAIKTLPEAFAADPERFARFEREAKTLASLNHPHIAAIYAVEKSAGRHALVMELVEGDDLSQRIADGAMPVDEALPIAKQIAEALEAAHEQGIIHRDLKPANIKVRADGTVKVLDFGLAKLNDPNVSTVSNGPNALSMSPTLITPAMTQVGLILGTAAYMSPEQARGKAVDKRSDIWAFGAVLFEMVSGRRAFSGDNVSETLAEVMKSEPPWQSLPSHVPAHLVRLIRQCLVKDPRQRIRDMGDVRLALSNADDAAPAPARDEAGRHWLVWAFAAVAVVSLAVAAFAIWTRPGSEDGSPSDDSAATRSRAHLVSGYHSRRPDRGLRRAAGDRRTATVPARSECVRAASGPRFERRSATVLFARWEMGRVLRPGAASEGRGQRGRSDPPGRSAQSTKWDVERRQHDHLRSVSRLGALADSRRWRDA
jgi:serine/threonine protein kinase